MKSLIVIGDGGHAEVLIALAVAFGRPVSGVASQERSVGDLVAGVPVLGDDSVFSAYPPGDVELVNAVGSVGIPRRRAEVFARFSGEGHRFATLVHPSAHVAEGVVLGEGAQIMAGAVVQTGCVIGSNCIVNTGAILDHHCEIDSHTHIAPGAVCSGGVKIGGMCHVGAGATVIQGVKLEDEVLVAAGAVVTRDVARGLRVKGVPARMF